MKSARTELPRKEGIVLCLWALRTAAGWGCEQPGEALGISAGAKSLCSVERPGVPDRNSLGHPHRGCTCLRRVLADSSATVGQPRVLGSSGAVWQPPGTEITEITALGVSEPPGCSWADGDGGKMKREGVAITKQGEPGPVPAGSPEEHSGCLLVLEYFCCKYETNCVLPSPPWLTAVQ